MLSKGFGAHVLLARTSRSMGDPVLRRFLDPAPRTHRCRHTRCLCKAIGNPGTKTAEISIPLADLVAAGEATNVEFKSTLRMNLQHWKTRRQDGVERS